MSRSIPALVKPELLVWARSSAGLSLDSAADLARIDSATLEEWESGHDLPSISELRRLGEIYKRPIAVFFLAEPPKKFDAQREFRRLAGVLLGKETPEFLQALRWTLFRREAAMEVYRLSGEVPASLSASLDPHTDPEVAGQQVRELLGISWDAQLEWQSPHEALNAWRAAMEARGVLVFQTSDVALAEMRGTCIPDEPLPAILLNGKDAPQGRIFSLVHEFAHLLFHAGGHKTSRMVGERSPEEQPLEVAANAFAAATLLPAAAFLNMAKSYQSASRGEDSSLKAFAQRLKVSPEVILRRLATLGIVSNSIYRSKRQAWGEKLWYISAPSKGGGPPVPIRTLAKDGRGYTRLVLDAYDQRLINTSAASDYLGVKARHFPDLRRELSQRPTLAA